METQSKVHAMAIEEVTLYGKSYTECPLMPFYIWDIYLSSSSFLVPVLQIYMYHVLLTLDSFSDLMSRPSSCATRSHMVTLVPLLEFPVSCISNHNWNPGLKWMQWVWEKLLVMEGAILNTFYPLVIYETFTLVPFRFLCACLANLHVPCATYLIVFPV